MYGIFQHKFEWDDTISPKYYYYINRRGGHVPNAALPTVYLQINYFRKKEMCDDQLWFIITRDTFVLCHSRKRKYAIS